MRLSSAQATLKSKRFDETLLAQLEDATLKNTDLRTLQACAASWMSLLRQGGAPALQDAVSNRYRRLVRRVESGLKPLLAALKPKAPEPPTIQLLEDAQVI